MRNFKKYQRGFTLIEIMVVVVILGILAALIVPKIMSRPDQARAVKAQSDILAIQNALDLYRLDNGSYPTNEQGLNALVHKPSAAPEPRHWQAYLKSLPTDPWGHTYQYSNPGQHSQVDVFSLGADGQQGGTGSNKEIGNWTEEATG